MQVKLRLFFSRKSAMKQNNEIIEEITPLSNNDVFYVADRRKARFDFPIHCHEECELTFCQNANGARRTVGDSSEVIGDYDLVLITGSQLEHIWEQYKCESEEIKEITIQFSAETIPDVLLSKNQFFTIKNMLEKAQKGLCFPESAILKVYDSLVSLPAEKDGFYATLKFFAILYELSLCEEAYTLSSNSFSKVNINSDSRRVRLVQNYINEHYKEEIRLKQLSEMVKMSPVSFSRFFKLRTGKSLSDYIVDIRLGHAARLLFSTTNTVSEICYECGFNNISNFNRLFKKNKNCSPKEFREMYKKKSLL